MNVNILTFERPSQLLLSSKPDVTLHQRITFGSLKSETKSEANIIERFVSTQCNQLLLQLHATLPTYDFSPRNVYKEIHVHPTCLEFLEHLTTLYV